VDQEMICTRLSFFMYHLANGLFFERLPSGNVRIVQTTDGREPKVVDGVYQQSNIKFWATVTGAGWSSAVAAMTMSGETSEQFQKALTLHES
jgi:hypothetical protein